MSAPALPDGPLLGGFTRIPGTLWWLTDRRGTVLRFGPASSQLLGIAPEDLEGRRVADLVHPGDVALVLNADRRVRAGDEITGVSLRMRKADGTFVPVTWTAREDRDRGVVLAVGRVAGPGPDSGVEDDRLALVASVLQHMPAPVYVKDAAGRYLMVNWEFCRLAGLRFPGEVVGRRADDLWPESERSAVQHAVQSACDAGHGQVEVELRTVDGARTFLIGTAVVPDGHGAVQAVVGVATDITDGAAAAAQLAARDRVVQAIMQASPDVIAVVDDKGAVVEHNAAMAGVIGPDGSLVGPDDLAALVHPEDVATVTSAFAEMLTGVTPDLVVRYRVRHRDRGWVTVDSRGRVERSDDGGVAHTVVVTRDVTDALAAESDLRSAVVAAERASLAKSEFLSRMSHELRTPLNSILGFAQLLQMDDLAAGQAEAAGTILHAGRQLLALIDGVLDIARIETGHLDLHPTSVPIGVVLDTVLAAGGRDGAVEVHVQEDLPEVWADPRRLEQVVTTLVDAARQGSAQASVTLRATAVDADWVQLDVEAIPDGPRSGVPTPAEGVALALARYLAGQMGGRLGYVPAVPGEDRAASFVLELPARPPGSGAMSRVGAAGPSLASSALAADDGAWGGGASPPHSPPVGSMRLLVVTADDALADLVRQVATLRSVTEVTVVTDGEGAAEALRKVLPDLVLVELPATGNADPSAMAAVRALAGQGRPVVAVVGSDPASDQARRVIEDGVDAYLARPLDARALLELVDAARDTLGGP